MVALSSRLATAEKLEEPAPVAFGAPKPASLTTPATETRALPSVVPDPFAPAPAAAAVSAAPAAAAPAAAAPAAATPVAAANFSFSPAGPTTASSGPAATVFVERPQRGGPSWFLLLLLVIGAAFGVTAAIAIFMPKTPAAPAVVVQVPAAVPAAVGPGPQASATGATAAVDSSSPVAINVNAGRSAGGSMGGTKAAPSASASTSAASTGRTLDLHGIGTGPTIAPVDDMGNDGPKAPGNCLSEGQVQQVIGLHQVAIRRSCWERSSTTKLTANVAVSLTVGTDGSAQSVSASGDDPSVAKCIENDVRGWRFPAMGCTQKTGFSFKFVRQ